MKKEIEPKIFFNRKRDVRVADESRPLLQINMSGKRAYGQFVERDAAITICFPRATKDRIDEVCTFMDTSVSDFLRQVLFIHLYGRVDFLGLLQTKHDAALNSYIDTAIVPDTSPQVEREVKAAKPAPKSATSYVKVWIPKVMKDDLEKLTARNYSSLSSYCETVISSHLFGVIS